MPKIHLLPADKAFFAGPHESILEAALRAGLPMNYGCTDGRCGECRCRLLAGEVKNIRHYDYCFSAAEKAQGELLACCHSAVEDVRLEAMLHSPQEAFPEQQLSLKVHKIESVGDYVKVLHLRTPRSEPLRFMAGQTVTLHIDGLPPRPKSLASCPCNGTQLQVHFRRRPNDAFADYVFDQLRKGDRIELSGPQGDFVLSEAPTRPLAFVAYETGFAGIKSLIEQLLNQETEQLMDLYWVTEGDYGHYMENYCRSWADVFDGFRYTPVTLPEGTRDSADCVEACLACLSSSCGDWHERESFMALPSDVADQVRELLLAEGIPAERLHISRLLPY